MLAPLQQTTMDPARHLHRSPTDWLRESLLAPYVEVDLVVNDKALARLQELDTKMRRYRPPDALKQFLQALKLCADSVGPNRSSP